MPYTKLKRSIFQPGSEGTMPIVIIALVIGVPILITLISVFIIVVIYCCCQKNGTAEDELPKSLIENCKRTEPPPEEQGKYLPELFDASAFQFKGPLIIKCPKLHILKHDLTSAKPAESNIKDHVRFDKNLNVAYNIGENVEIIVKSYGQGTETESSEMTKENGADEDDETNEQENDCKKLIIKNKEKEVGKQSKRKNSQSQKKKSQIGEVRDPKRKCKPVSSIRTQVTQPSRYSESSTQTPRLSDEANVESPKKQGGGPDIANSQKGNFSITYERKNKPLRERTSNILFEQTTRAPNKSRMIVLRKEQQSAVSTEATNISSTMKTVNFHHWVAEEINPSISGSYKNGISERIRSEENR
ncbi:hypothetical protein ACH3XW_27035 [Acanthocheilonema viteae]